MKWMTCLAQKEGVTRPARASAFVSTSDETMWFYSDTTQWHWWHYQIKRLIIEDSRTGIKKEKKNWQLFLYYEKTQAMDLAWLIGASNAMKVMKSSWNVVLRIPLWKHLPTLYTSAASALIPYTPALFDTRSLNRMCTFPPYTSRTHTIYTSHYSIPHPLA